MNTKLFVGNLSFQTTENDLQDAFQQFGNVIEVNLVTDKMSGRPRGFAFVTMESPEAAQAAIAGLNGRDMDGRNLSVSEARPREERSGGGKSYGGGNGRGPGRQREYSRH
jgi:cold-inducible RNA-binding protein